MVWSGSVFSNWWKFCLHISSSTWRSSNVRVPNVRIDAILMNSENIFLSKQIEQVDITDPSIDQRGKTNKPSVKKTEGFLCSKFKDVSPAVQWQRGAWCRWQKGYTLCKGSQSWDKKKLPQHQGQEYLGSPCSCCVAHEIPCAWAVLGYYLHPVPQARTWVESET